MKPEISWIDDPRVFRVNQMPAHSDHTFYESEEAYREGRSTLKQLSLIHIPSPRDRTRSRMPSSA